MAKISTNVTNGLSDAISKAQSQINGDNSAEELLNSGVKVQKKRHRRTKAEIEADKVNEISQESNSLFDELIPKEEENRPEWEKRNAKDHDEFCAWELEKAKLKGLENPEFDYRNYYEKGNVVWLVRYYEKLGTKELLKLTLRTIYPRMIVGVVEKQYCECIGYNERDCLFLNQRDALNYFNSIKGNVTDEYNEETGKKKRKRKTKIKDEESEDINDYIDREDSEEEENNE